MRLVKDEHFLSVDEISQWIKNGPILQPPIEKILVKTNVSAHGHNRPQAPDPLLLVPPRAAETPTLNAPSTVSALPNMARSPVLPRHDGDIVPSPPALQNLAPSTRQSTRKRVPRDILHPTHHGKAYQARDEKSLNKTKGVSGEIVEGESEAFDPRIRGKTKGDCAGPQDNETPICPRHVPSVPNYGQMGELQPNVLTVPNRIKRKIKHADWLVKYL
jgi:hypothetical protein